MLFIFIAVGHTQKDRAVSQSPTKELANCVLSLISSASSYYGKFDGGYMMGVNIRLCFRAKITGGGTTHVDDQAQLRLSSSGDQGRGRVGSQALGPRVGMNRRVNSEQKDLNPNPCSSLRFSELRWKPGRVPQETDVVSVV